MSAAATGRGLRSAAEAAVRLVCVLVAAALLLAATGCSDSGDDDTGDAAATTEAAITETPTTTTVPLAVERDLPIVTEPVEDLPGYNVYRPQDLEATGAPLPVITWANGGCFRYDTAWAPLLESWARAGFVVVAITSTEGVDPRTAGMSTAEDQAAAIDWAFATDESADSPFAGHLDLERIVAAGNSCGGVTALTLASQDDRVSSVFVLSGSSVLPGSSREAAAAVMGDVDVPVGYAIGGPEDISTGMVEQDYEVLPDGVPRYVARRSEASHQTVSTDEAILGEVAEISTNWIDFTLYGNPELEAVLVDDPCSACPPGTWTTQAEDLDVLVAE